MGQHLRKMLCEEGRLKEIVSIAKRNPSNPVANMFLEHEKETTPKLQIV